MAKKMYIADWECLNCGRINAAIVPDSKGNPIRVLKCPGCGASVPEKGRDGGSPYIKPKVKVYLDEKFNELFGKIPNWICGNCKSENASDPDSKFCCGCGAPIDKTDDQRVKVNLDDRTSKHIIKEGVKTSEDDENNVNIYQSLFDDIPKDALNYTCKSCGAKSKQGSGTKTCPHCGFSDEPVVEKREYQQTSYQSSNKKNFKKPLIIAAVTILAIWLIWFFFISTKEVSASISDKTWSCSIGVEDYKMRHDEDWEGEVPNGVEVYERNKEVHHYDEVPDGTEEYWEDVQVGTKTWTTKEPDVNNNDGTITEGETTTHSEPIYENQKKERPKFKKVPVKKVKCKYRYMAWAYDRTEPTKGVRGSEPYYYSNFAKNEREQSNSRSDVDYEIIYNAENGKSYSPSVDRAEWNAYSIGDRVTLTITKTGIIKKIKKI